MWHSAHTSDLAIDPTHTNKLLIGKENPWF